MSEKTVLTEPFLTTFVFGVEQADRPNFIEICEKFVIRRLNIWIQDGRKDRQVLINLESDSEFIIMIKDRSISGPSVCYIHPRTINVEQAAMYCNDNIS